MTPDIDAAARLAAFAAETTYETLSDAARIAAKRCLLDTLGVTAAASSRGIGHNLLYRMVHKAGGAPEASVIGFGGRAPVWLAALLNGAMARAVDFDDNHDESMTHPSSVVVPAAMAMAEWRGGVTGRELIAAIAVGNEILCRMGLSVVRRANGLTLDSWFPTSVFGAFGGVAACGRILGFDAERMRHAFGIALFEASGTLEAFSATGQSTMMRGMVTGLTAKSATLAATMAEIGITGVPDSLEGQHGFYRSYFANDYRRETLFDALGEYFVSTEIGAKPWPTCRYTHAYIDATLQLVAKHDIRGADIAAIDIDVAGYAQSRCEPLAEQRRPHNLNHAGHALPYLVAAAAARRRVVIDDLVNRLDDPAVLALAERVSPRHNPRFSIQNKVGPARVEISVKGGGIRVKELETVYGGVGRPVSQEDLAAKFRDCVAYSLRPPRSTLVDEMVDRIMQLEDEDRVDDVLRILT